MKQMIQPPAAAVRDEQSGYSRNESVPNTSGGGLDLVKLKQYLHVIVRRIWIVAICFAISLILAVVNISKQESVYKASTSILLTRGAQLPAQLQAQEYSIFGDFIETQVRILYSRSVVSRAREMLNLSEAEVNRLLRQFSVWSQGKASVITIFVDSLDAQFSADFANAIARSYMEFKDLERVNVSQNTAVNLTQQANKIREELKKAEDALILFKKENAEVITQKEGNIAAGIMSDVAKRAATFRLERMILEMQRPLLSDASDDVILTALNSRYVPSSPQLAMGQQRRTGDLVPAAVGQERDELVVKAPALGLVEFDTDGNSAWVVLKKRKSELEQDLKMARESLRDTHPSVARIINELRVIDNSIDREVQYATQKYFSELEALTLKESSLVRVESMWLDEAMKSEIALDRYEALKNDADRLKKMLDSVFSRIREVDISSGVIPDNVTVIEEAVRRDTPVTPRKVQSIFLAALIGIGVGIGIIFGLDFLDDSIRFPEEVSKYFGVKFLGIIPSANWSSADIRTHLLSQLDPKSGLAEAYRNIRAALLMEDQGSKVKTLLVTSSVPREGKTTTSLNLAISLAQAGLRVLLVDADMRRGEIHKFFGLEGGRGLSDILKGQAKTESVIQRTGVQNLDIIATGPFPINPAELILRNEFRAFVDYAQRTYDKVVFDGPPVMAVSEAAVLASLVDRTIMVIWAGKTSRKLCQITLQNLQQRGARIEGCILNNLEFGRVGYYYYSTYYSYYNYDYRYDEKAMGT
jgi:capsular exopolysaccharide synthesis family protein